MNAIIVNLIPRMHCTRNTRRLHRQDIQERTDDRRRDRPTFFCCCCWGAPFRRASHYRLTVCEPKHCIYTTSSLGPSTNEDGFALTRRAFSSILVTCPYRYGSRPDWLMCFYVLKERECVPRAVGEMCSKQRKATSFSCGRNERREWMKILFKTVSRWQ